jgi:hypothetical protein
MPESKLSRKRFSGGIQAEVMEKLRRHCVAMPLEITSKYGSADWK